MILRSMWTATACTAALLAITGCTAPEQDPVGGSTATATASASGAAEDSATASPPLEDPDVRATTGAIVDDFPSVIAPLPDAEIITSSVGPGSSDEQVIANLMMRTGSTEEEVLEFYAESLEEAGFDQVGDPSSDGGVTTQTYQADGAAQLISVGIAADSDDGDTLLITVGGPVIP